MRNVPVSEISATTRGALPLDAIVYVPCRGN